MPKQKTKELKSQYLFRVYLDDENDLLNRAMKMFRNKFDSTNDMIKYFALIGAEKMIGDNSMNQSINYSEIRRYMKEVDEKLKKLEGNQKINFVELQADNLTNQSLLNLNTKLLIRISDIDLNDYTREWKYNPHNKYEVTEMKNIYAKELLNERK